MNQAFLTAPLRRVALHAILPFGLLIFLVGQFAFPDGSVYQTWVNLGFLFPSLLLFLGFSGRWRTLSLGECLLGVLLGFYVISSLWSDDPHALVIAGSRAAQLALFCVGVNLLASQPQRLRWVLWLSSGLASMFAVAALIRFYLVMGQPWQQRLPGGFGALEEIIIATAFHGLFMIFLLRELVDFPGSRGKRVLIVACLSGLLLFSLAGQSRGPTLSLLFVVLAWGLSSEGRTRRTFLFTVIGTIVVFLALIPNFFLARGTSLRPEIWAQVIAKIAAAPMVGHGAHAHLSIDLASGQHFDHPHNLYLSVMYEIGAIGLLMWLSTIIWVASRLWQQRRQSFPFLILSWMAYSAICTLTDVGFFITHPSQSWALIWLPLALGLGVIRQYQHQSVESSLR